MCLKHCPTGYTETNTTTHHVKMLSREHISHETHQLVPGLQKLPRFREQRCNSKWANNDYGADYPWLDRQTDKVYDPVRWYGDFLFVGR